MYRPSTRPDLMRAWSFLGSGMAHLNRGKNHNTSADQARMTALFDGFPPGIRLKPPLRIDQLANERGQDAGALLLRRRHPVPGVASLAGSGGRPRQCPGLVPQTHQPECRADPRPRWRGPLAGAVNRVAQFRRRAAIVVFPAPWLLRAAAFQGDDDAVASLLDDLACRMLASLPDMR